MIRKLKVDLAGIRKVVVGELAVGQMVRRRELNRLGL